MNTLARILRALNPVARAYDRGLTEGYACGYDSGLEDGVADVKRQFADRLDDLDRTVAALSGLHAWRSTPRDA